jgi:hypothetical protein
MYVHLLRGAHHTSKEEISVEKRKKSRREDKFEKQKHQEMRHSNGLE